MTWPPSPLLLGIQLPAGGFRDRGLSSTARRPSRMRAPMIRRATLGRAPAVFIHRVSTSRQESSREDGERREVAA